MQAEKQSSCSQLTSIDLLNAAENALALSVGIIKDIMDNHNIYPSVGNFAHITDTLGKIRQHNASEDKSESI
jgi:hypothetical protein